VNVLGVATTRLFKLLNGDVIVLDNELGVAEVSTKLREVNGVAPVTPGVNLRMEFGIVPSGRVTTVLKLTNSPITTGTLPVTGVAEVV